MAEPEKRMVKALIAGAVSFGLASCASVPAAGVIDSGEDEADPAPVADWQCPEVRTANAWVNKMPGPGDRDQMTIVSLRLKAEENWILLRPSEELSETLALELKPGGNYAKGTASYRERPKEPLRTRVTVTCQGKQIADMDIGAVY